MGVSGDDILVVPEAFGVIEKNLFRSSIFHPVHFPFIRNLKLNTVLVLSPEKIVKTLLEFFQGENIIVNLLGHKLRAELGWKPVGEELIKEGLELVLDSERYPLLIMCSFGVHQTGILVGCLRRLQLWNLNSIIQEYRLFVKDKSRYMTELFVEVFDLDLITLPSNLPEWLSIRAVEEC